MVWFSSWYVPGEMQNIDPKADLVPSCSWCVSVWTLEDSFARTFRLPSLFVRRWLGESEPRIDLRRELQVSFWPRRSRRDSASAPTGHSLPAGCPMSILAPCQECVCAGQARQGGGIATERKGKAASLFFLLQALSHFNRWERHGLARLKVTSFCCLAPGQ